MLAQGFFDTPLGYPGETSEWSSGWSGQCAEVVTEQVVGRSIAVPIQDG